MEQLLERTWSHFDSSEPFPDRQPYMPAAVLHYLRTHSGQDIPASGYLGVLLALHFVQAGEPYVHMQFYGCIHQHSTVPIGSIPK